MAYPAISSVDDTRYLRAALIRGEQIISAPMSALRQYSNVFNVLDYGPRPDGTTSNQDAIDEAVDLAVAAHGSVYFPAAFTTNGLGYRGEIAEHNVRGLRMFGDGEASILTHINVSRDTIAITADTSGQSGDIYIHDMQIVASSGKRAIVMSNVLYFEIGRVKHIAPMLFEGSGGFCYNVQGYGEHALFLGSDDVAMTGTGPLSLMGCFWYNSRSAGSPSTKGAVRILGNVIDTNFHTCQFSAIYADSAVQIDGRTGATTAYGDVSFYNSHAESCGNSAGTASNFIIGATTKFGGVHFYGGAYYGQGDSVAAKSLYWLKLYPGNTITVEGVQVTNQAAASGGFTHAVRMETGFSSQAEQFAFRSLILKDSIAAYSDADSLLTVYTGNDWNGVIKGSATYNPANLVDGDGVTTTVTATGAALGMFADATFSLDLQGIMLNAWVSAANTVSVRFQNETGGAIDLGSGTIRVRVRG